MPRKSSEKRYLGTDLKPIDVSPKKENNVMKKEERQTAASKPTVKPEEKPQVSTPEVKENLSPVFRLSDFEKEALNNFVNDPEAGLAKYKAAVESGELSEQDQAEAAPVIVILERMVELKKIAEQQTETVNQPIVNTEEKEMTATNTQTTVEKETTTKDTVVETNVNKPLPVTNNLAGAEPANNWAGLVLAGATALVTTGYDMLMDDDLSKERVIGSVAATVVAVGAQYVVQRTLTEEQSTAVNCAVGTGIGLATGALSRMAINIVRDKANEAITEI